MLVMTNSICLGGRAVASWGAVAFVQHRATRMARVT